MLDRRALATVAVVLLLALAGCTGVTDGGPTNPDTTTDAPTTAPETTPTTSPAGPNGTLSVHFLNVGQGSSSLVVTPAGETMLIDTGDWRDDGEIVLDYLRERDIDRIDYLVTSHPDADHIGGHEAVIEYFETEADGIGAVYDPGITSSSATYTEYLDAIEAHDVTLYQTQAGDSIPMEGVETEVLAPPAEGIANGDANENSIVLRLGFGQSSLLLPGDGESASESYLIEEYGSTLNVSVLSAGHHGSSSSSSDAFLEATSPRVAVISSAYDSQYGHPDDTVLQRFDDRSIPTYWTGTHGTIRMTTNGSAIRVATQADAPTDALALRDGDPVEPGSTDALERRTVVPVAGDTAPVATDGGTATTETATPTETTTTGGTLAIATINADGETLNDETVTFTNSGDAPLDLSGWTVSDEADHTYTFPDEATLDPGAELTLHTGSGTDTATDVYWGSGSPIWNNAGDTVIVTDENGDTILEEAY
ncbi:lamin tail domain-containing protein [Halococcoides cellulosivorans]|uniref:Competence protein n=1 Tax=Halococcoides cellulosivorans TaxID=1679096 RepID=A0A2R4X3X0_9EURY|nr:lamin tail domain-containing protein [Halococcoides cellulosivorans]AWB28496.1 competence protein [Halococcoides cellulosivorans]